MQETQVRSLGWEDPLKKGVTTHFSILSWRILWTEEPGGLQSSGLQRVRHNWMTNTLLILLVYKNCKWSVSVQFSSVTQSCPTPCNPMDCSTPGLLVHHQLPEFSQTHVHWVGDAIQPSHPVVPFSSCLQSFPASRSFPMSQFFTSGGQSIGVSASTSVLPVNTQDWSPLGWTGWSSLMSKGLSRVFSNTTVQKRQFFGA